MIRRTLAILFLVVFAIPTVHAQVGDPRNTLSIGVVRNGMVGRS